MSGLPAVFLSAGLVGIAAAFTLRPAVFALYFLFRKDYRALGWMAGAFASFTALGAVARPGMTAAYFTDYVLHIGERYDLSQAQNLTLFGAAQRFTGADGASALWVLAVLAAGGALARLVAGDAQAAGLELAVRPGGAELDRDLAAGLRNADRPGPAGRKRAQHQDMPRACM